MRVRVGGRARRLSALDGTSRARNRPRRSARWATRHGEGVSVASWNDEVRMETSNLVNGGDLDGNATRTTYDARRVYSAYVGSNAEKRLNLHIGSSNLE